MGWEGLPFNRSNMNGAMKPRRAVRLVTLNDHIKVALIAFSHLCVCLFVGTALASIASTSVTISPTSYWDSSAATVAPGPQGIP